MIDRVAGVTETEIEPPAALVVNLTMIGAIVMPFAVPLTVILNVPTGVVVKVLTLKTEIPAVVAFGAKAALAPAAAPE